MTTYIFDMDGVVLDTMPMWDHLGEDYLKLHGRLPKPDFRRRITAMSMPQAAQFLRSEYGFTEPPEQLIAGLDALAEGFYTERAPLKDGVLSALERLSSGGNRIVLATATDRHLAEVALMRTGAAKFFAKIYTCTELALSKDKPECFRKILELEGCRPEEAIVVEDALHAIRSARAAGIPVLAVYDESSRAYWLEIQELAFRALESWHEF